MFPLGSNGLNSRLYSIIISKLTQHLVLNTAGLPSAGHSSSKAASPPTTPLDSSTVPSPLGGQMLGDDPQGTAEGVGCTEWVLVEEILWVNTTS